MVTTFSHLVRLPPFFDNPSDDPMSQNSQREVTIFGVKTQKLPDDPVQGVRRMIRSHRRC